MATQIVVNGTLEKPDGTADAGTVEAKLSTELYDTAGSLVASRTPVTDTLDANGDWSLTLYATNDTGTTPTGAFYYFTFTPTSGGRGEHVRFELDKATTPVRFEDLAEPAANAPSLLGSYVETGADLDTLSSGTATDGQVPTADGNGAVVWEDQTGSGIDTFGTPVATDYARFTDADTIEGRSPAEVRSDLNVEDGATADQTAAEIKTAYESNADTNEFSDAEQTKLAGIETAATADQTGAEIKVAYEGEADTNAFTDADHSKLDGIEASADVTDAANVNAAGATMNSDTDVSSTSWVLDEDTMASDDATKVPTQQSTKAYTDTHIADTTAAHAASAISVADTAGHFTGTQTEEVLAEIQTNIDNFPEIASSDPVKVPITTNAGVTTLDVDGLANKALAINSQTGTTYTPVAADAEALVLLNNANPITVTLPEGVLALGESVSFVQNGDGQVSFAGGTGATMVVEGIFNAATRGKRAVVQAILIEDDFLGGGADVWLLVGGLEAA